MLPTPHPHVTVCAVAYDHTRRFPVMWRTANVRSAALRWSLPTGLHECGQTLAEQAALELNEELGLTALPETWRFLTTYENILPEDRFHWVISMGTIRVTSLGELVNKEPTKHGEITLLDRSSIDDVLPAMTMDRSMKDALTASLPQIWHNMENV